MIKERDIYQYFFLIGLLASNGYTIKLKLPTKPVRTPNFLPIEEMHYYSFKLNSGASMSKEQEEQMKMMTNMMIIFMAITAFTISSGIAIYWITSNVFTIIQNLLVKRGAKHARD